MSTLPIPNVTPEEYLAFERAAETKHEYVFGEIVSMAGGTPNHSRICVNATQALANHLASDPCRVYDSNLRVLLRRRQQYAYPDAFVVCGELSFSDELKDTITNPKLIVEVLSPSTRNCDLGDKSRAYFEIPSMTDLLILEQDKVWVEHFSREPGGKWQRSVFTQLSDVLPIASLSIEIPVAELYAKVDLT